MKNNLGRIRTNLGNTNEAIVSGQVHKPLEYAYERDDEKFYSTTILVFRRSGTVDNIPIVVPGKILHRGETLEGKYVLVQGQFRSRNYRDYDERSHLALYLFAYDIEVCDSPKELKEECIEKNEIFLDGYVCKKTKYMHKKHLQEELAVVCLAVNRKYGSDYIPCILWGEKAKEISKNPVGTHLKILGRIQSRIRITKHGVVEEVYEVLINEVEYE